MIAKTLTFTLAAALVIVAAVPAAAQRPAAPAGVVVYYVSSDGKPMSDGRVYRVAGVFRSVAEANRKFNEINAIHRYRAYRRELATELEVQAAMNWARDPKTGFPAGAAPEQQERPAAGGIAGAWQGNGTIYRFTADGGVRDNYGNSGRWTQEGNTVTWVADVFSYTAIVNGNSMQVSSRYRSSRSGNYGDPIPLGTFTRLP